MDFFLPCPGCERHVHARDAICPFCGEALPLSLRQRLAPRLPTARLGRAATLAFGAALAASTAAGCGDDMTGDPDSGAVDSGASVDSGMGGTDAGGGDDAAVGDDAGPVDAGVDSGGIAPAYGGPFPVDAGQDAGQDAGGGIVPAYGGPILLDGGGAIPAYGTPPMPPA